MEKAHHRLPRKQILKLYIQTQKEPGAQLEWLLQLEVYHGQEGGGGGAGRCKSQWLDIFHRGKIMGEVLRCLTQLFKFWHLFTVTFLDDFEGDLAAWEVHNSSSVVAPS